MCTGAQVREARRLLRWSSERLAGACSLPGRVIRTYEATGKVIGLHRDPSRTDRVAIMRSTLEQAGIVFLDGEDPGVQLRRLKS